MKITVKTLGGGFTELCKIKSVAFCQSTDAVCDSLTVKTAGLPDEIGEITQVMAFDGEKLIFNGLCDCCKKSVGATGEEMFIYARSRACLLTDNEALPFTYNRPTARQLFITYAKRYGFTYAMEDIKSSKMYEVPSGASCYGAINRLVSMVSGSCVRINADDELILPKPSESVKNTDELQIISAKEITNRSEPISQIGFKRELSDDYDCLTVSKAALDAEISRTKYVNLAACPQWQRSRKTSQLIKKSFEEYKLIELTVSGECKWELYQRANINLPFGSFNDCILTEKEYSYSPDGEKTVLKFKENIDAREISYVDK